MNIDDLFFRKTTQTESGCVIWQGATSGPDGYGKVRRNGKLHFAHRYAWELANGPIPQGMIVCHSCDVPSCVNHEHLFLGTSRDNVADMMQKGRRKGGYRSAAKLTPDDILEIKERWAAGETQQSIADAFGIVQPTVSRIVTDKRVPEGCCPTCRRPL